MQRQSPPTWSTLRELWRQQARVTRVVTSNHPNHCRRVRPSARKGHSVLSGEAERWRFEEVLETLEKERQRFDEDLRRLTAAAAYLRALLPTRRRRRRLRQRCTASRRRILRCSGDNTA